jgi:hypothetical protein
MSRRVMFIWSRDKYGRLCLLSRLRMFIFHLISFLDPHPIAFEATLCFSSL